MSSAGFTSRFTYLLTYLMSVDEVVWYSANYTTVTYRKYSKPVMVHVAL